MTEAIWSSDPACPQLYEHRKPIMLAPLRPAFGASLAISSSLCGALLLLIPAAATALAGKLARPALPHWGTILQRCAAVAPGNWITVDRDRELGYVFAEEALLIAYAGSLSTIKVGSRVDVRYNVGGAFSFKINEIRLPEPGGRPSIVLSQPRHARPGSPCS